MSNVRAVGDSAFLRYDLQTPALSGFSYSDNKFNQVPTLNGLRSSYGVQSRVGTRNGTTSKDVVRPMTAVCAAGYNSATKGILN